MTVAARDFLQPPVDEADSQGVLGKRVRQGQEPELVAYSRRIFTQRNDIVHEGQIPNKATASELLDNAREAIEFIRGHVDARNSGHEA